MHILLTDILTCPRCGPEQGLVVLADTLADRRVVEGRLGCPNCREEYPVRGGVADLRLGPPPAPAAPLAYEAAMTVEEKAYRIAALLGIGDTPGPILLLGAPVPLVAAVAALLPAALPIAEIAADLDGGGMANWVRLPASLPFRSRSLRGIAAASGWRAELAPEAARALSSGAHLVVDPAPPGAADSLRSAGFDLLLDQEGAVVASAP